jgi:hypothetical protein
VRVDSEERQEYRNPTQFPQTSRADSNIDQYEQSPAKGWYLWMMDEIEKANFVLTVCTPKYLRRFRANEENGIGMGVTWAGSIITQELYSQAGRNSKYIPVIFTQRDTKFITKILQR